MRLSTRVSLLLGCLTVVLGCVPAFGTPSERVVGRLETVATFSGPMPTGVTVSHGGRIFVNFPRWGDHVTFTVGEVRRGRVVPFPDAAINRFEPKRASTCLVSVQSVVVDPRDRLWVLDTGSLAMGPVMAGGPKLIGVDLRTNRIFKKIAFPPDVALKTTYLNDVRFDLRRGKAGMAYITDSSGSGHNGIIVVDLESGRSWRRLHEHASTKAEPGFLPVVEGQPFLLRLPGKAPAPLTVGSDGIAISADGKLLYYCSLMGRHLYSVSVDALSDPAVPEERVAATVRDLGEKGGGSDGLESDAQGRVYLTNYEHNAIMRRSADGRLETLVHDPRVLWPDTLSLGVDGYLYFTANQIHRLPGFHGGRDLRQKPYQLFRVKLKATPVLLR